MKGAERDEDETGSSSGNKRRRTTKDSKNSVSEPTTTSATDGVIADYSEDASGKPTGDCDDSKRAMIEGSIDSESSDVQVVLHPKKRTRGVKGVNASGEGETGSLMEIDTNDPSLIS